MNSLTDQTVARHYANSSIEATILAALRAAGKDPEQLTVDDLAPVDEFHIGGREVTVEIGLAMNIAPAQQLLDVGCGIGGAARYFAEHYRAHVTGIDLTKDFVDAAESLSKRLKLQDMVEFHTGSALDLPFPDASFDGAYIFHAGMNISDKARLFSQIRRVIKAGGMFAVYEVMRTGAGELSFPVPWAAAPETSFLAMPDRYREILQAVGFRILSERNRLDFALEFFAAMKARASSPLGLPLLMGPTAPLKMANMVANLKNGLIAPVEMICRAG
jgi:SAM-dependent methyltransferase